MDPRLIDTVHTEIVALHDFFVGWFSGATPNTAEAFAAGFGLRFADDFTLIPPAGGLLALAELAEAIRRGHGASPDFRIAIRSVGIVAATDELVVASYEEWQRNARNSTPSDNGRAATVVFERRDGRLRWRHVHETWLPVATVAAGDFDF